MKERSKISKKIFNSILIIEAFVTFAILSIVILDIYSNNFGMDTFISICIFVCFGIIMAFVTKPLFKTIFESSEISEESKKYVHQYLSKECCVEVIPIGGDSFLTKELPQRAKFYAQIIGDGKVKIYIKFNNESERIDFDEFIEEYFIIYYKVL